MTAARRRGGRAAVILLALVAGLGAAATPITHHGPERTRLPYDDPRAAEKRVLFERINRDRRRHGVPPVEYEPRAALVGDQFCLDSAANGLTGHFDLQGRAPYVRWALAGGVDFHAENAASYSTSGRRVTRPVAAILLEAHDSMMDERPPHDGHRRTILDPVYTHVGIGLAVVGGELRTTEEFTRAAFEWIETPAGPLRAGQRATFAGRPLRGWGVGLVEIRFEPPPRPLTLLEVRSREAYSYPPVARTLTPARGSGPLARGDFDAPQNGPFSLSFKLDKGPGLYFVLCHLRKSWQSSGPMRPATAAMITAVP